jgi:transaldolase
MQNGTYLKWVIDNTQMKWWHDSADPAELDLGLERGAVGVTTNPFLTNATLAKNKTVWRDHIAAVLAQKLPPEAKAEALMQGVVTAAAAKLLPEYKRSGGKMGFVCAQVNPLRAGERECMLPMAKRFHAWAPNIAVKLPVTAAGIDVLEDCIAAGITVTATVSFTVPQVVAVAERCRKGIARAKANGIEPGKCFAVIMIGRLDDYLREVARDSYPGIDEAAIRQAGLAATKRAYRIFQERGYEAVLLVAALRGEYHLTELVGADLVMSLAPAFQDPFISKDHAREERIEREVPAHIIQQLSRMPEFVRAYEPDGMSPEEFVTYGATQRTLSQFCEVGWKPLESM